MVMGTVWKTVAVVNAADSSILLLSSRFWIGPIMVLERIANPSGDESRLLSSSLSRSAKIKFD